MSFRIERDKQPRESFGEYKYDIFDGDRLVARYWHDHRGDDRGIEFLNGEDPKGLPYEFISGGGPQPLALSERAVEYLRCKLQQ